MTLDNSVWKQQKVLFLLPALLALCCFANTLRYKFVYDDRSQIVEAAPVLQNWQPGNLAHLFDRDIWGFFCQELSWEGKIRTAYYRPLFGLFVMINYSYAGLNPVWWHLTSILLHLIAALLAYRLLFVSQRIADPAADKEEARSLAILGAILFTIHPAQSESVAWVAAYVDALSAIFIFGSLLAYLRARTEPAKNGGINLGYLLLSAILYALALLTKEVSIVVPAIIAAYELFVIAPRSEWLSQLRLRLSRCVIAGLPFLFLTIGYLGLRIAILGAVRPGAMHTDFPELRDLTRAVNLFTLPAILLKYIKIIVWPFALNPMYPIRYVRVPDFWNFYAPALFIMLLAAAGAVAAYRSVLTRIGFIWLLVPLLPVLDIRSFKPEDLVHDRYLYISLLGAGLLFAAFCRRLNNFIYRLRISGSESENSFIVGSPRLAASSLIIIAALLAVMASVTIKQNDVWADEWQLWTAASENVPDSCTVNLELGRLDEEAGRDMEAVNFYEKAKSTCPDSVTVYYKLGLLYGRTGDLARAADSFQRMASLSPFRMVGATAHFNLGVIYEKEGDLENAVTHYQQGLALNPTSKNAPEVRRIIGELTAKLSQGVER